MDAKDRYRMLLRVKSGQDPEYYEEMPEGGYGKYNMFDLEEDEAPNKNQEKKPAPQQQQSKAPEQKKTPTQSSSKFLDIIQGQNERYAQLFTSMLEKLPTQKDFHSLATEIDRIKSNQEVLAKEIEDLQPPSPEQKSQQIQDANPEMIPVGDYFRGYYANTPKSQRSGFDGTLDSIAGKSFRDYLNL